MNDTDRQASILVVEDEIDMARILEFNLSNLGHEVSVAGTGDTARRRLAEMAPDLVLLDLRLPDAFGVDLLREIKGNPDTASVPTIVVSALGDEETVVEALNLGAEDYVTKPFRIRELLARVNAALRRHVQPGEEAAVISWGPFHVDPSSRQVSVADEPVDLTRTEFDLLRHFAANPGRVFTRKQLCRDPLGTEGAVQERTIDAHMRTIRRKLGDAGRYLVTVWGVGYKMAEEE